MEWWKDAARVYGEKRDMFRDMTDFEFRVYADHWRPKAIMGLKGVPSATTAKWYGFCDAVQDEEKQRILEAPAWDDGTRPTIESDAWLNGVLKYLYEEKEHAPVEETQQQLH